MNRYSKIALVWIVSGIVVVALSYFGFSLFSADTELDNNKKCNQYLSGKITYPFSQDLQVSIEAIENGKKIASAKLQNDYYSLFFKTEASQDTKLTLEVSAKSTDSVFANKYFDLTNLKCDDAVTNLDLEITE